MNLALARVLVLSFVFIIQAQNSLPLETPESPAPYKVGVLYWSMNIPGQVAMRKGLEGHSSPTKHRLDQIRGPRP